MIKILITEGQFVKLKQQINERLGVPDNILNVAEDLYEKIGNFLKTNMTTVIKDQKFNYKCDYRIGKYQIKNMDIKVSFTETEYTNQVQIMGMGFQSSSMLDPDSNFTMVKNTSNDGTVRVNLDFAIPQGGMEYVKDFLKYYFEERDDLISPLAHELLHAYQKFNLKYEPVSRKTDYVSYMNLRMPFPEINNFLHMLYYMTEVEKVTRPTEVASLMQSKKIEKNRFLEFIKQNDVVKRLTEIKNFKFSDLKNSLLTKIDVIDDFFNSLDDVFDKMERPTTDEEKVNTLLSMTFNAMNHINVDTYRDMLGLNDFAFFFAPDKIKRFQSLEKYMESIRRRGSKNPEDFFVSLEKKITFDAEKILRKIYKLYDMALDENKLSSETNESIVNWDLHHKVNKDKLPKPNFKSDFKKDIEELDNTIKRLEEKKRKK